MALNGPEWRSFPCRIGSLNLHSLLSLHVATVAASADSLRQALILMFLSLPVFQDPAPWNIVWRAGELFPIDIGSAAGA